MRSCQEEDYDQFVFCDSSGGLKPQQGRCTADCRKTLLTARLTMYWHSFLERKISTTSHINFLEDALGVFDPASLLEGAGDLLNSFPVCK